MNTSDRMPPQALDVERQVLSSMLHSIEAVDAAMELLIPDCFYMSDNKTIFNKIKDMSSKNETIDILTVTEKLKTSDDEFNSDDIGYYLAELSECPGSHKNTEYYCKILIEKKMLRDLINAADLIKNECYASDLDTNEVLTNAEIAIYKITEQSHSGKLESSGQLLSETFENIEKYHSGEITGLESGLKDLDDHTGGFQKSDLVIIAARPAMGKTSLALTACINAAVLNKKVIAFFSLEMSKQQLMERVLCSEAKLSVHSLRNGTLPKRDMPRLSFAAGPIADAELWIDDTPYMTPMAIRSKSRRLKSSTGLDLIIIDYLQLMSLGGKVENRQQEISTISRMLKCVAKELNVPVIALSQLSRTLESRPNKRPILSDLRESGAIEQDADIVLFIYRDEVYDEGSEDKGIAELLIRKFRNGPVGTQKVAFIKEQAKFENLILDKGWGEDEQASSHFANDH